jgi:hypothetical protein
VHRRSPSSKARPHRRYHAKEQPYAQDAGEGPLPPWQIDVPLVYRDKETGQLASHGLAEDAILPGTYQCFRKDSVLQRG